MLGVMRCARAKTNLLTAFAEIAESLGSSRSIAADFKALAGAAPGQREVTFPGPLPGNAAAPEHLAPVLLGTRQAPARSPPLQRHAPAT